MEKKFEDLVKITGGGRIYIEKENFFGQKRVVEMIKKMLKSDLYASIINQKKIEHNKLTQ